MEREKHIVNCINNHQACKSYYNIYKIFIRSDLMQDNIIYLCIYYKLFKMCFFHKYDIL